MNIVLLNPPGDRYYVRNYYCGSTSKSNYLFQPLDLLILSGRLSQEYEIIVIDCIAEKLNTDDAIKRIIAYKTDVLVCLVSMVSWKSDSDFLFQIRKQMPNLKVIVNGDVFFEEPERKLEENKTIDAVIFDFISSDAINYLNDNEESISNMLYRKGDKFILKKKANKRADKIFSIPIPRHELFINKNYKFPFAKHYPFTAVLTNFGCTFQCSFCIANNLGFRYRIAKEIIEELRYISKLGIKEIFFEDMSFGLPRDNAIDLCNMIITERLKFGWTCFSRVDVVDRKFLLLMKEAGCHTIIFGVESASEEILRAYHKGYTTNQVRDTFKMCREIGIKTVATFILGLPEETKASCLETIRFAKEIDCDYASFNIAVPRPGTELRKIAIKESLITKEQIDFDHSGKTVSMSSKYLSKEELTALKKKAIIEFYLRPSYILGKLTTIQSYTELREHIRMFLGLLVNNI